MGFKPSIEICFLVSCISISVFSQPVALIVSVGNYPEQGQWSDLSASNDAELIRKTLTKQGFEPGNVLILQDEQATREGILNAMGNDFLSKVQSGGIAFFHFSGHGQQIQDDNGDEIDGYDETIVPFDSPKYYQEGAYEGEKLIRDEELGAALFEVRKKLGPKGQLIVLIDACHSGTATRGYARTRGTPIPMADRSHILRFPAGVSEKTGLGNEVRNRKSAAPMVAFFASAANQSSYEYTDPSGRGYGMLSYAFCKAMEDKSSLFRYRELFDLIKLEIAISSPRQIPQADGDLSLAVFGGNTYPGADYYTASEWIDRRTLRLDVGILAGLYDKSVLELYPFELTDTAQGNPIAQGTVEFATPWDCNLYLDRPIEKEQALSARLFLVEKNFGTLSTRIKLDIPENLFAEELRKSLAIFPAIRFTNEDPELILQNIPKKGMQLFTKDDYLLWENPSSELEDPTGMAMELRSDILEFAQGKFLRSLDIRETDMTIDIQLLDLNGKVLPNQDQLSFRVGEQALVKIINRGGKPFYFSLIDLQPDNHITLIIPWEDRPAIDYFLRPGASYIFEEPLQASLPLGTEMLKCFATAQPLNLFSVTKTRGKETDSRTNPHPLERLFGETYFSDEKTRGGSTSNYSEGGGAAVRTVTFRIEE